MRRLLLLGLAALAAVFVLGRRRRRPAARPAVVRPAVEAEAALPAERPSRTRNLLLAGGLVAVLALAGLGAWRMGLAGGGGSAGAGPVPTATATATPRPTATPSPSPTPSPTPTPRPEWRLFAAGDVLMDLSEAAGIDPFAGIRPRLSEADLALVNVEMAISTAGEPEEKLFVFRAPPSAAGTIAAAGIDAGNLGNNHSLDFGVGALLDTIRYLRDAGVAPVGGGNNDAEAYAPASFKMRGVRVAVVGASRVFPYAYWAATGDRAGLASAYAEQRLVRAVREASDSHDVVIVMVHWGVEGAPCPDGNQRRLGAALLDAGASVVLGSHPHVLQPVVQRNGGLIAYSLGNFVWRPRTGPGGETGVLEVRFDGPRVVGFRLVPHTLDERGSPVPAGPEAAARIEAAVTAPCE